MNSLSQGYVSIDEVVMNYIADQGENTLHNYLQYLHYAFEARKEYRFDAVPEPKTSLLALDTTNNTVDFPADYINWIKVGAQVDDRVLVFIRDSNISLNQTTPGEPNPNFFNRFLGDVDHVEYIGYDAGGVRRSKNMYFQIDPVNKRFQFGSEIDYDNIYLEYVSTGMTPSTASEVPYVAIEFIKKYIYWKVQVQKRGLSSGEAQIANREWNKELHKVVNRVKGITVRGIIESSYMRLASSRINFSINSH